MTVVDKYKPVVTKPRTISPVVPTLLGAVFAALIIALFSPATFVAQATFPQSPAKWATVSAPVVSSLSSATGLGALRETLDAELAPLDSVSKVFVHEQTAVAGGNNAAVAAVPPSGVLTSSVPTHPGAPGLALATGQSPGTSWRKQGASAKTVRVLMIGASSIQHALGTELEREMVARYSNIVVKRRGKAATGLARPDVFDWPAETRTLMRQFKPDVVIGQFGGNDAQNLVDDKGNPHKVGSETWKAEYSKRLQALVTQVKKGGAEFYLLGLPAMKSERFNRTQRMLDDVSEHAVKLAGGHFIATYDLSVDAAGKYRSSVKFQGESGLMRMSDGIHFTRLGGQFVAYHLARRMEGMLGLIPKPTPEGKQPAQAFEFLVPNTAGGANTMLAFVPVSVPDEGLPVWYLLHGADASYQAWSVNAHDMLQQVAADNQVIIVMPDGEPFGWWLDSTKDPSHQIQTWFLRELMPWVDSHLPSNKKHAISGISMGGHGALTLALTEPAQFKAVTSMSGAVDLAHAKSREALQRWLGPYEQNQAEWEARSALHMVRESPKALQQTAVLLTCGQDDTWFAPNKVLHDALDAAKVTNTWMPSPGGHTWDVWLAVLPVHAAFVHQALAGT